MTDKKRPTFICAKRRGFMQGVAVAGGAVASGAVAAATDVDDVAAEVDNLTNTSKGYEVTEHIKKYYARARF